MPTKKRPTRWQPLMPSFQKEKAKNKKQKEGPDGV
jgi:hypothetical protein